MLNKPDIEVEYKFRVEDKKSLISTLNKTFKQTKNHEYQSNIMFDNPKQLMQKTDERIRVRTKGHKREKTLTYKKPLTSIEGAKREIEYEIDFIDTTSQIEKILSVMEFDPTTSYERHQSKWLSDSI